MDAFYADMNMLFATPAYKERPGVCELIEQAISLLVEHEADLSPMSLAELLNVILRNDEYDGPDGMVRLFSSTRVRFIVLADSLVWFDLTDSIFPVPIIKGVADGPCALAALLCPELADMLLTRECDKK